MGDKSNNGDISIFLSACSKLLYENAASLENTANHISDLVMEGERPNRDVVVALQAFDRLKQEFDALGQALAGYVEHLDDDLSAEERQTGLRSRVVASIAVSSLRQRLLRQIEGPVTVAPKLVASTADLVDQDIEL